LGLRSLRPRAAHPGARRLRAARPLTVPPVPPTSQEPMMTTAPTPSTATRPSGLWLVQVDESVRLQADLFAPVNGRWLREHETPAVRSSAGAFHALRDLSEERVREISEQAAAAAEARDPRGEQVPDTDHARVGAL